ncbi:MAG: ABC transporter ATP-binding protein [Victivallales bacterium]|nr:ABC transporter ATP-binding protein [Victivallales bacterium]
MSDTAPILCCRELCFSWHPGAPELFHGLNWSVQPGEAICLTAPSGRGKSTLLKLAAGLLKPTSGSISAGWQRTGFLFQEHQLMPWLTAAENITFVLSGQKDAEETARRWLAEMNMEDCADSKADQLSGGQQSRVNLARALAAQPEMLFLDEPFTGIDDTTADKCAQTIRKWKAASPAHTLIMTSHIPKYADMCNAHILPLDKI